MKFRTRDQFLKDLVFSMIDQIEIDAQSYDRSRRSNLARSFVFLCVVSASLGGVISTDFIPSFSLLGSISLGLASVAYLKAKVAETANGEMLEAAAYTRKSYDLGLGEEEYGKKFERKPALSSREIGWNLAKAVHARAKSSSLKILLAASSAGAALLLAGALVTGAQALFGAAALALVGAGYYARQGIHAKREAVACENRADRLYENEIKKWDPLGGNFVSNARFPESMEELYKKIDDGIPLGPIPKIAIVQKDSGPDPDRSYEPERGTHLLEVGSSMLVLWDRGPLRFDVPRRASPIYKGAAIRPAVPNLTDAGPSSLKDAGPSRLKFPGALASQFSRVANRRPASHHQRPDGRKGCI